MSRTPRLASWRFAAVSALLFAGTALLFSRAAHFGFINYDDPTYVTENLHVQAGLSWAGIVWAFTAPADYWHPLPWLSHMLDWQLYGPEAAGHHLTNIWWHAINAVLAFLVFRRLAGGFWPGAFAAALYAWHPLRVESVAWITERKDVMSGCFFLLTLLAYTRYVEARVGGRTWRRSYLLTLACFAAGLMCKPMLVTLPLLLLILDFWPVARGCSFKGLWPLTLEKIPFFALSAVTAVVTVIMQKHSGAFVLDLPFAARAGNAIVSLSRYVGKFLWPFDLAVCYPHPGYWPVTVVLGGMALALACGWFAWQQRRTRPWIIAGALWYLVALLPVIGLVQTGFQAIADRYTYLPMLGLGLALAGGMSAMAKPSRARVGVTVAAVLVLLACAARTWDQQGVWRDSVTLFEHAVAVTEENDMAEDLLASALYAAGRIDEAAAHAERARALNPRSTTALTTLAGIRERQGRAGEAIALYREALALRPSQPAVQGQLGLLELTAGRIDEARMLLSSAHHAAPALRERTRQLARAALGQGDVATALVLFETLLAVVPDDLLALSGAAEIHARRQDFPTAARMYRRVVELAPDDARAHAAYGYMLLLTGDRAAGLLAWRRALELDPALPGLRERLRQQEQ